MSFGFFDWIRVRTRDAVLAGAEEASRVLDEGAGASRQPTETVVSLDVRLRAVLRESDSRGRGEATQDKEALGSPDQVEQTPTSEASVSTPSQEPTQAHPVAGPGPSSRKPQRHNGPDRRVPQRSAKTEAYLDLGRGIKPPE